MDEKRQPNLSTAVKGNAKAPIRPGGQKKRETHAAVNNEVSRGELHSLGMGEEFLWEDWGIRNKRGQISLNHLLNFRLPPRLSAASPRRKPTVHGVYRKERFVNANFRFVVDEAHDCAAYLADPDKSIDWEFITEVIVPTSSFTSCPICLSWPRAPKVTKCGHVYCWPCLLHYLHLGEKSWRKCPICYESVYRKDLRAVRFCMGIDMKTASYTHPIKLSMTLIQREMHSAIALPRLSCDNDQGLNSIHPPSVENAEAVPFAKVLLSTAQYRSAVLTREIDDLQSLLKDLEKGGVSSTSSDNSGLSLVNEETFIKIAIREASQALESTSPTQSLPSSDLKYHSLPAQISSGRGKACEPSHEQGSAVILKNPSCTSVPEQKTVSPSTEISLDNTYFFYQSSDGRHVYLHPFDIKLLRSEHGSYANFPNQIDIEILSFTESSMNEDIRKKCKYLSHLPLGCDVTFAQAHIQKLISPGTYKTFKRAIDTRVKALRNLDRSTRPPDLRRESNTPLTLSETAQSVQATFPYLQNSGESSWGIDTVAGETSVPHSDSKDTLTPQTHEHPPIDPHHSFAHVAAIKAGRAPPWTQRQGQEQYSPQPLKYRPDERNEEFQNSGNSGWSLSFENAVPERLTVVSVPGHSNLEGATPTDHSPSRAQRTSRKGSKVLLVTNVGQRGRF
ncbi:hypothetical protein DFS34DRAFT_626049 [Phlyctochytrium arcticum]|nr:hypothetical protein DFS34DRAFT_626049 [Phlyctochytrium arcticum]